LSIAFEAPTALPGLARAADAAARDAMREKDLMAGRAALISRFAIKVEPGPDEPQLAQASRRQVAAR